MEKAKKGPQRIEYARDQISQNCETDLFDPRSDNETLETYLLTTMTTEMIVRNSIKGHANLINGSGESPHNAFPNLGRKSQAQEEPKNDESWRWRGRKVGNRSDRQA